MHELSVTRGILAVALEAATRIKRPTILSVDIVIGELTSIVDDSVQFYFDIMSRGTAAAGATLRFHREAALGRCIGCGETFETRSPLPRSCPRCGSLELSVTGGRSFYVESIEVADEGARRNGDPEGERPGSG
jgi:hydrogenase nickel incorporation protein HypA/HybF